MGSIDERVLAVGVLAALQNASLGLLALLLAFTFSMAVARYEARKQLVLEEANAIGTTALRAGLLPEGRREAARAGLREYVAARLAFHEARRGTPGYEAALAATARGQQQLWSLAAAAVAADPHALPASLFAQSLNDTIDASEKRMAARENRVPGTVLALLLAVAVLALGFVGGGAGLAGRRRLVSTSLFALMLALVVTLVVDIDQPREGLVRVQQESMHRLEASLAAEGR